MVKKIDIYIVKKFFSTFFFAITLILAIVIVFDVSEKIDDFLENDLNIYQIIFEYYIHFIPYFANLFSPLFMFISVIFFTSKMANNSEIIAILNSGMSFYRMLRPFLFCAIILALSSFILGHFIIPESNKKRIEFENNYIRSKYYSKTKHIHMQIQKGQYIYMESFNPKNNIGYKFTLENIKENKLTSKLTSNYTKYNKEDGTWSVYNYTIREFGEKKDLITSGNKIDTTINLNPSDFTKQKSLIESMDMLELNKYIKNEELKGNEQITYYKIEKHKRNAFPFSSIILTLIAVAIASQKIKGGVGIHLGIGILITFSYILFMQISTTFSTNSSLSPALSVWIPNIIYTILCYILLKKARK